MWKSCYSCCCVLLTIPLAVLEGTVVFSVDLSWVVGAVSTVVFMLVVVNVDSVVYASIFVASVIAVDDVVDASEVFTVVVKQPIQKVKLVFLLFSCTEEHFLSKCKKKDQLLHYFIKY